MEELQTRKTIEKAPASKSLRFDQTVGEHLAGSRVMGIALSWELGNLQLPLRVHHQWAVNIGIH